MDFGVQVNVYRTEWSAVRASVEAMEKGDWDSVWFADHFIPPGGGGDDEQEAMTAFEGLAVGVAPLEHTLDNSFWLDDAGESAGEPPAPASLLAVARAALRPHEAHTLPIEPSLVDAYVRPEDGRRARGNELTEAGLAPHVVDWRHEMLQPRKALCTLLKTRVAKEDGAWVVAACCWCNSTANSVASHVARR